MEKQKDIFDFLKFSKKSSPDQAYFEQLAKNVISGSQIRVIPLYKKPLFWLSSAAAIFITLLVLNFENPSESTDTILVSLNDISKKDVMHYIDQNLEDFDTELFTEIIPLKNIEKIEFHADVIETTVSVENDLTVNFDNIEHDDILNYLRDEEIDILEINDSNELLY